MAPTAAGVSVQTHVWGAAMQAINGLTYGLVADGARSSRPAPRRAPPSPRTRPCRRRRLRKSYASRDNARPPPPPTHPQPRKPGPITPQNGQYASPEWLDGGHSHQSSSPTPPSSRRWPRLSRARDHHVEHETHPVRNPATLSPKLPRLPSDKAPSSSELARSATAGQKPQVTARQAPPAALSVN